MGLNPFQWFIDKMIDGATPNIENLPVPQQVKDAMRVLLPIFKGDQVLPLPSQYTSWQYFTGEAEASKNLLGELLDLFGVTMEAEKGHFAVQSSLHPEHVYKCEFAIGRGGYSFGIPLGKVLRFISKALKKLQKGAPWVAKAATALRKAILLAARHSRRLQRVIGRIEGGDTAVEKAIEGLNSALEGWGGEGPLQNIRRSILNLQNPSAERGPPTGLFGPIFIIDLGITLVGNLRLILLFMGGPVHGLLGWMPFAYKYMGVNFGYGVQLAADVAMNIAWGEVQTITETNAKTGAKRTIPRPR